MRIRETFITVVCLAVLGASSLFAGNWPSFRGDAAGSGISPERNLPVEWSTTKNVKWRTELPDIGNSTPVVWGNRVFITQWIGDEDFRGTLCFDRRTGKQLWKAGITHEKKEKTHATNPYCAASPVTDGERVIATYGPAGLVCYDFEGKEMWNRNLGPIAHVWGWASSPVLYKNLCILYYGPGEGSFLVALDKKTGKTVWKFTEPKWDTAGRTDGTEERRSNGVCAFGTPIVVSAGGHDELVMSFPTEIKAFDPLTGKELWDCKGLNPLVYTCPLYGDGTVVAMGGFHGNSLAVKAGGTGDVTGKRLWHKIRDKGAIGSGLVKDGYLYYHNSGNVIFCCDLATGEKVWERTRKKGSKVWSSFLLAGDNIYSIDQKGDTQIIKASAEYKEVAVNSLGETVNACIAASDGNLFIRTHKALWCIGK